MAKISSSVQVSELDATTDTLIRQFRASALAEDSFLKATFAELEDLSARITTANRQDAVLSKLDEADGVRDEAVRVLGNLISGYSFIPIAEKKAAAEKLKAVFDKYGKGIANANYATESGLIESLLEDLGAATLTGAINALDGMKEAVATLRAAQDEFAKAADSYTDAKTGKGESASSLKKPILACVNGKIVPYLSATSQSGMTGYAEFAAKVEDEITRLNGAIAKRSKKAKSAETAEKTEQ